MKFEAISKSYYGLLRDIQKHFAASDITIWNQRNKIKILNYNNINIIAKSFKPPHIINRIVYSFFRNSKAKKSYKYSIKIGDFAPNPIGYCEYFRRGLLYESYFLSEEFAYDFTIRDVLVDENYNEKNAIFEAFADFTNALHSKGIEHLDYSPGNILIKKTENSYLFKVVDVNRMHFRHLSDNQRLENFAKLWAKDEDLIVIVKAYAKYIKTEESKAISIALRASKRHKNKKNFKKRLRGQSVVD